MIGIEFVKGAALLLSLAMLESFVLRVLAKDSMAGQVVSGLLFGGISVIGMILPLHLLPGVIFDPRSVILSVAGFWGGPIVGAVAGAMAGAYRMTLGGTGAVMGITVVVSSVAMGLAYRALRRRFGLPAGPWAMLAFGLVVHAAVILCAVLLPDPWPVIQRIGPPMLLVFAPATVFLALILADIDRRFQTELSLRDSEARYRRLFYGAEVSIWDEDLSAVARTFDDLRRQGVANLRAHLEARPELGAEMARAIRINAVNPATLALFGARSAATFISSVDQVLTPASYAVFVDELCAMWEGRNSFRAVTENRTLDGRIISVILSMPIPRDPAAWRSVPVSILDITERVRAEAAVRRLNVELEERVGQRTAELQAANRELESFAYAVSHDLRAPLRAIEGFSQALVEDVGDRLEGQARAYLDHLTQGSRNMNRLIDGLLTLSRVTQGELVREAIDLSALADEVVEDLRRADPGRAVAVAISPGIRVKADARLMRAALENLLGNAWKFTLGRPDARIEMTGETAHGRTRVAVRDNGAGFDMAYADKLFVPFTRLHREEEFPGTGIGLSTVQRIINRHGGRLGAEGAVGQGATFWFEI